jgi:hypothetical protein
VWRVFQFLKH